jgi:hypothetical protein
MRPDTTRSGVPITFKTAHSFAQFTAITTALSDKWEGPWFRGQDRASDRLRPRRYRYYWIDEDEIRSEFKRRAPQLLLGAQPSSEWERYFLMQHYGMPTRLLDWSEGALLALHFALISNHRRSNAAVWAIDPFWLNGNVAKMIAGLSSRDTKRLGALLPEADDPRDQAVLNHYLGEAFPDRRPSLPRFPLALQPPHIDRRIAAQLSCFTIHGADELGLERFAEASGSARLAKITVPRESVHRMLLQLLDAGITEATVYPDLYGLSLELTRLHTKGGMRRRVTQRSIRRHPPRQAP